MSYNPATDAEINKPRPVYQGDAGGAYSGPQFQQPHPQVYRQQPQLQPQMVYVQPPVRGSVTAADACWVPCACLAGCCAACLCCPWL